MISCCHAECGDDTYRSCSHSVVRKYVRLSRLLVFGIESTIDTIGAVQDLINGARYQWLYDDPASHIRKGVSVLFTLGLQGL